MIEELEKIKKSALKELNSVKNLDDLEKWRVNFLGRKSFLANFPKQFKNLSPEEKVRIGSFYNQIKTELETLYQNKKEELSQKIEVLFDFDHPGSKFSFPSLPLIQTNLKRIIDIFRDLGFYVIDSNYLVSEYENFDSLNMPPYHPARDMWDTIWLKKPNKYLLRTHTSAFQVPFLLKFKPPVRGIVPGKVFRFEATDARHDFEFYQIEGISVSENSNFSHLRFIFKEFFKRYFEKNLEIRFRPSYFPFTEPSVEVDLSCLLCQGKGCLVCKFSGWLEVAGAGMIHPFVLKQAKIDPNKFQGYAFGTGLERLIMLKYEINDIRLLHSADLRTNEI
ncbi:Phenylalanine--tRNA ligase alpha subunit [bacterium HR35]|nr:Phenylalanine--tRNA ligase alpha subunit [bacterium HR35]